jgi:uncharacterized protein with von Willebrand factor type A (vWA) domain
MSGSGIETIELDLPALCGAFAARLHDAGVPVTAERAAVFARALAIARPVSRRRLYWTARAILVTDPSQRATFDAVFASVFGAGRHSEEDHTRAGADPALATPAYEPEERPAGEAPAEPRGLSAPTAAAAPREETGGQEPPAEVEVPTLASDEELLRAKHFDALTPGELAELYRLMARMRVATPLRRTRRARRARRGTTVDVRHTLRRSMRSGGDPVRLSRRRRRVIPRRMVLLCDISGSMEPYARAYLQFLTCAAGSGAAGNRLPGNRTETFVFATRLTRLTRALATRSPERAIQRAAEAVPDWSSGTRIGAALKTFNDRYGRRGMARGAVIVILSDGWERADPDLVGREMARLRRLAHRIVWVNPRAAATGFAPKAGGMAAALPYCDAFLSGESLAALGDVVRAIARDASDEGSLSEDRHEGPAPDSAAPAPEPWASATPVAGSSVAMPSGWGPSRGRTTPGWQSG